MNILGLISQLIGIKTLRLTKIFARGLSDGFPKFVKSEGALGYKTYTKND